MAFAPLIIMGVSAVMAASAAIKQGQAQSNAATYNSQVATQNQGIAAAQSEAASEMQQRDTEMKIGAATAAYGASGVQMADGSPTDVLASSARNATLNGLTLKYNYQLQGMGYQNQINLDNADAVNSKMGAGLGAAGALIGGASKMASAWPSGGGGTAIPQFGGSGGGVNDSNPLR